MVKVVFMVENNTPCSLLQSSPHDTINRWEKKKGKRGKGGGEFSFFLFGWVKMKDWTHQFQRGTRHWDSPNRPSPLQLEFGSCNFQA
jgi:hypothetical protein